MLRYLIVFISAMLCFSSCAIEKQQVVANSNYPSEHSVEPDKQVEFIHTEEELAETGKWKDKSTEELCFDAFNCDRGADYLQGCMFLYGLGGFTVDVEHAYKFFEVSASLGFAPALDKIRCRYMEDCPNPFLLLVYVNLTIANGHPEFILAYHKQRNYVVEHFGLGVAQEIEKIAERKAAQVLKNQKELSKATDKTRFFFNLMGIKTRFSKSIVHEDSKLDGNYWQKFSKFNVGKKQAASVKKTTNKKANQCKKLIGSTKCSNMSH